MVGCGGGGKRCKLALRGKGNASVSWETEKQHQSQSCTNAVKHSHKQPLETISGIFFCHPESQEEAALSSGLRLPPVYEGCVQVLQRLRLPGQLGVLQTPDERFTTSFFFSPGLFHLNSKSWEKIMNHENAHEPRVQTGKIFLAKKVVLQLSACSSQSLLLLPLQLQWRPIVANKAHSLPAAH